MNQNLYEYLSLCFPLTPNELKEVGSLFRLESYSKGDFFLKQGQYCKALNFVQRGYMRFYALKEGKEVTQWISPSGYFVTDLNSLLFGEPSRWNIQALEDTEMYSISKSDYESLGEKIPNWSKAEKSFIGRCFVTLENRVHDLISLSAEERYHKLIGQNHNLLNEVPLQYVASMLGMSPETLSRIRAKMLS
ncbi:Crp/Fnr family transcriptional regulator [Reichenbachiella versicolor]|uniref:Crp/Fnr family transcriptional regulator n=1 Tax=Reichenbachiella versicolor TaxID=1821036 RepID=UPI000D6DEBAA|nr:Crp/Fnr family transcriptional regulator [Reichenbachiella versicolor]